MAIVRASYNRPMTNLAAALLYALAWAVARLPWPLLRALARGQMALVEHGVEMLLRLRMQLLAEQAGQGTGQQLLEEAATLGRLGEARPYARALAG